MVLGAAVVFSCALVVQNGDARLSTASGLTADFTCSPSCSVATGTKVSFTASTNASDPVYYWDLNGDSPPVFNDPGPAQVSQEYDKPGTYTIGLHVVDVAAKQEITVTHNLVVSAPPPKFSVSIAAPASDPAGSLLRLIANATTVPGTHVVAYHWRLDGSPSFTVDTGSLGELDHRFNAGSHQVQVQAIASSGATSNTATTTFTTQTATQGTNACANSQEFGWIVVTAPGCIQLSRSGSLSVWTVDIPHDGISLNGLDVTCPGSGCRLRIESTRAVTNPQFGIGNTPFTLSTNQQVDLRVLNTMDGSIDLGLTPGAINYAWSTPPAHTDQVPFITTAMPGGQQFAGSPLLPALASIAFTSPNHAADPGVAVSFDMHFTFFGVPLAIPVTLHGDPEGDWATAPNGWSVDLSGIAIPPLIYFNHLVLTYQDHMDAAPGYTGPPLNGVFEADGSATIMLTGWTIEGDVVVANGSLIAGHFAYDHGNGSSLLGAGLSSFVGLNHLSGDFQAVPFNSIGGDLEVSLADYTVGGGFSYAEPHGDQGFQFAANGQIPILLPGVTVQIGILITGDPTPGFGASGTLAVDEPASAPVFSLEGGLYLYVGSIGGSAAMEFGVHARLSVIGIELASAAGFMNQNWVAGCGHFLGAAVWAVAPLTSGEPGPFAGFGGCDNIASYSIAPSLFGGLAHAGQGRAVSQIRVPAGASWANLEFASQAGAPQVHLHGPGIDYTSPAASGGASSGKVKALVSSTTHRLIVGIQDPKPGDYTVTTVAGAPAVTHAYTAMTFPKHVRARVSGHGNRLRLRYTFAGPANERVTFVERSPHGFTKLGTVGPGSGTLRIHPGQYAGRKRTIAALFTIAGLPQGVATVAHFTAPALKPPGAPKRLVLRYHRHADSVLVSWRPVAHARQYQLRITGRDGRRLTVISRRTRWAIPAVFPGDRIHVTVRARASDSLVGRSTAKSVRIRALRRPRK
jgi:hypothetical protein